MKKIFIAGCGDIGKRVATYALERGEVVTALVRSPEKGDVLQQRGIAVYQGNLDDPESLVGLPVHGAGVFYFAPPPGGGHVDSRVRNFCGAIAVGEEPSRIVYLSTSGVYGSSGTEWVTEATPPDPQTPRGKRRLDAELYLKGWGDERNVPVIILRVTGIYGPGRLPVMQLREGHPIIREDEANVTNRIHTEDLVRICIAAEDKGERGDIFNVSDGHPGTMTEYFNAAADLLGLPRPPQIGMEEAKRVMSPLMLSYIQESRRLDNRKMLTKLGVTLLYPDLASGIAACKPE